MKNYNSWQYSDEYNYAVERNVILTPQGFRLFHKIGGLVQHLEETSGDLFPALNIKAFESHNADFFRLYKPVDAARKHDVLLVERDKFAVFSNKNFIADPIDCVIRQKDVDPFILSDSCKKDLAVHIETNIGFIGRHPAVMFLSVYLEAERKEVDGKSVEVANEKRVPIALMLDCATPYGSSVSVPEISLLALNRIIRRKTLLEEQGFSEDDNFLLSEAE